MTATQSSERVMIRMDLNGDLAHKFNLIKRHRCIESNTEVVRYLIVEYAGRINEIES